MTTCALPLEPNFHLSDYCHRPATAIQFRMALDWPLGTAIRLRMAADVPCAEGGEVLVVPLCGNAVAVLLARSRRCANWAIVRLLGRPRARLPEPITSLFEVAGHVASPVPVAASRSRSAGVGGKVAMIRW